MISELSVNETGPTNVWSMSFFSRSILVVQETNSEARMSSLMFDGWSLLSKTGVKTCTSVNFLNMT